MVVILLWLVASAASQPAGGASRASHGASPPGAQPGCLERGVFGGWHHDSRRFLLRSVDEPFDIGIRLPIVWLFDPTIPGCQDVRRPAHKYQWETVRFAANGSHFSLTSWSSPRFGGGASSRPVWSDIYTSEGRRLDLPELARPREPHGLGTFAPSGHTLWSPVGARALVGMLPFRCSPLFLVDAGQASATELHANACSAAWSPSGDFISFTEPGPLGRPTHLRLASADGSLLAVDAATQLRGAWGRVHDVIRGGGCSDSRCELVFYEPAEDRATVLPVPGSSFAGSPDWSPDDRLVAIASCDAGGSERCSLVIADRTRMAVAVHEDVTARTHLARDVLWSPRGDSLAILDEERRSYDVFGVAEDLSLRHIATALDVSWSAAGDLVAVVSAPDVQSRGRFRLLRVDDGQTLAGVELPEEAKVPQWVPATLPARQAWSPNGSRVALAAGNSLYVLTRLGETAKRSWPSGTRFVLETWLGAKRLLVTASRTKYEPSKFGQRLLALSSDLRAVASLPASAATLSPDRTRLGGTPPFCERTGFAPPPSGLVVVRVADVWPRLVRRVKPELLVDCAVQGGRGHDALSGRLVRGGPGNDTLSGMRSSALFGGSGDDLLTGGGSDYLSGGGGADRLIGLTKADRLDGGPGDDILLGGRGADVLDGGPGADWLVGGRGTDILRGGRGNDTLVSGWRRDRLFGGPGDDTIKARDGQRTVIDCGPGRDTAIVDAGDRAENCEVVRRARRTPSS